MRIRGSCRSKGGHEPNFEGVYLPISYSGNTQIKVAIPPSWRTEGLNERLVIQEYLSNYSVFGIE